MSALISTPKDLEKVLKILKAEGVLLMRSGDVEIHLAPTFQHHAPRAQSPLPTPPRQALTREQKDQVMEADLFNTERPKFPQGA